MDELQADVQEASERSERRKFRTRSGSQVDLMNAANLSLRASTVRRSASRDAVATAAASPTAQGTAQGTALGAAMDAVSATAHATAQATAAAAAAVESVVSHKLLQRQGSAARGFTTV